MNYFAYAGLFNVIVYSFVSLIIIFHKEKPRSAKYFFIFNFGASLWAIGYFLWQTADSYHEAYFWTKFLMFGGAVCVAGFYHFVLALMDRDKKLWRRIIAAYISNFVFTYWIFFSPLYVAGLADKMGISRFPSAGPLFTVFLIQWFFWIGWSFWEIFYAAKKTEGKERRLLIIFGVITAIAYLSACTNLFLWYDIPIKPWITPLGSIYSLILAIYLLRGKAPNLRLLAYEVIAYAIILVAILQIAFAQRIQLNYAQWITSTIMICLAIFTISFGNRESKHLKEINLLNNALKDTVQRVINTISMPTIIFAKDKKIIYANAEAVNFFGHKKMCQPNTLQDFIVSDKNPALLSFTDSCAIDNATDRQSAMLQAPQIRQVESLCAPFTLDNGEQATMMIIQNRQPPWGMVFNSRNFEPVPLALVRIFDIKTKRLVETRVTDNLGRFGFMVAAGAYAVQVEKKGFKKGPPSSGIGYLGEAIAITDENLMGANLNILIDPETKNEKKERRKKQKTPDEGALTAS